MVKVVYNDQLEDKVQSFEHFLELVYEQRR